MKCFRAVAMALVAAIVFASAQPGYAEWRLPTWLGGKPPKVSRAHNTAKKPVKPKSVSGKGGSGNLFTDTKSLFSPKPKPRVISKWPSEKSVASREKAKAKADEKESWLGSMFRPEEPPPPESIHDWMGLEQVKP